MVERLCNKSAKITLRPPCCCINFVGRRVKKFIWQSPDAIHPVTSRHFCPRQNKCKYMIHKFNKNAYVIFWTVEHKLYSCVLRILFRLKICFRILPVYRVIYMYLYINNITSSWIYLTTVSMDWTDCCLVAGRDDWIENR